MSGVISIAWSSAELALLPDQAERPGPAQPERFRAAPCRAARRCSAIARRRRSSSARPCARRPNGAATGPVDAERELDAGAARGGAKRARAVDREGLADADRARPFAGQPRRRCGAAPASASTSAQQRAAGRAGPAPPSSRPARAAPISKRGRRDRGGEQDGAAGRVDQRGAPISSISRCDHALRPAGPRSRRRRRAGRGGAAPPAPAP